MFCKIYFFKNFYWHPWQVFAGEREFWGLPARCFSALQDFYVGISGGCEES